MKKRNPIAAALRSPHLAPRVVQSKKIYSRKGRSKDRPSDIWTSENSLQIF